MHLPPAPVRPPSRIHSADVVKVLTITGAFIGGCYLLLVLAPFLLTVLVAAFLAVAADPAVRFFQRRGLSRSLAVGAFTACLVIVLLALAALFLGPLVSQADQLAEDAPGYAKSVQDHTLVQDLDERFGVIDKATAEAEKLPERVGSQVASVAAAVFAGVFGTITLLFLMVLFLLGGRDVTAAVLQVFPALAERRWWTLIQDSYRSVSGYVAGTAVIAAIAGAVVLVACLALGLPSPLPLAAWMLLLDVVPLVGAMIGAAPAVLVAFAAGGVVEGVIMLVVLVVYQQVENIVLQPAILGKVVALSPLVVFLAILAGSQLLGIVGALLAIPLAGVAQIFVRSWLGSHREGRLAVPSISGDSAPSPPEPGPSPAGG